MATRKPAARKSADIPDPFASQPELAPVAEAAPAAADANDAARSAIAIINTQLSEFDRVQAGLAELERRHKGVVFDVTTPKGMDDACTARLDIRKPRYAVEAARKAAKAPVLKLGRDIDARAEVITQRLLAIETPIDDQIKAQERKEAQRKADLEQRIADMKATPAQCIGKNSAQLVEVLEALDSLPLADFAEYRERAAAAQHEASTAVRQLLASAQAAEELAAMRAQRQAEEDRKAALQLRLDAIGDVLAFPYRTSARVQQVVDRLSAQEIGDDWQEYAPAARERKAQVLVELAARYNTLAAAEKDEEDRRSQTAPPFGGSRVARRVLAREFVQETSTAAPQVDHGPIVDMPVFEDKTAPAAAASGWPAADWGPAPITSADEFQRMHLNVHMAPPLVPDLPPMDVTDLTGTWEEAPAPQPAAAFPLPGPATDELSFVVERPSDAEILNVVAAHYDVTRERAATWLREMDVSAALAQMPLQEVQG